MNMVFKNFEKDLFLQQGRVNVVRIEDKSLYARSVVSLSKYFPPETLEPACFFKEEKEMKPDKILYVVGDILSLDLNDRRIVAQASKILLARLLEEEGSIEKLEAFNLELEEVFTKQFLQMSGDYYFAAAWDSAKYLKMQAFGIEVSESETLFEKLVHFMRVVEDLFEDWIIAFVNLCVYLTDEQYNEFCKIVSALQLVVLSYEQGGKKEFSNLENGLFIDEDYLEE